MRAVQRWSFLFHTIPLWPLVFRVGVLLLSAFFEWFDVLRFLRRLSSLFWLMWSMSVSGPVFVISLWRLVSFPFMYALA